MAPEGMKYRFQWNFPVFFSPHDPQKVYTCSQFLHASTNGGESWDIISPDLTRSESEKLVSSGGSHYQGQHGRGVLRHHLRCGRVAAGGGAPLVWF